MPQYHLITSLILAIIVLITTNSIPAFTACLISGIILDADHIPDYWLYKKKITINKEILQGFYEKWNKVPVLLHSIELLIPLWIYAFIKNTYPIPLAITLGTTSHLALDLASYELHPLSYFLTYRIAKKFEKKYICRNSENINVSYRELHKDLKR